MSGNLTGLCLYICAYIARRSAWSARIIHFQIGGEQYCQLSNEPEINFGTNINCNKYNPVVDVLMGKPIS